MTVTKGGVARPFISVSATIFDDPQLKTGAFFEDSPGDVAPFEITTEFDDVIFSVSAGLDLISEDSNMGLQFRYQGAFSEGIEEHSGSANLSIKF